MALERCDEGRAAALPGAAGRTAAAERAVSGLRDTHVPSIVIEAACTWPALLDTGAEAAAEAAAAVSGRTTRVLLGVRASFDSTDGSTRNGGARGSASSARAPTTCVSMVASGNGCGTFSRVRALAIALEVGGPLADEPLAGVFARHVRGLPLRLLALFAEPLVSTCSGTCRWPECSLPFAFEALGATRD